MNIPQKFPQQPVHDTNAPTGALAHAGIKMCAAHAAARGRCRLCEGGGCEFKQWFDPIGTANPNIKPIKSYGEAMTKKFGLPTRGYQAYGQAPNNASGPNNGNFQPGYTRPPQNQYNSGGDQVQYFAPPQTNITVQQPPQNSTAAATGSRNT